MKISRVLYCGDGDIITDYYSLTSKQKAKRLIIGKEGRYDTVVLSKLNEIINKCDYTIIMGIEEPTEDGMYLFNWLIDNVDSLDKVLYRQSGLMGIHLCEKVGQVNKRFIGIQCLDKYKVSNESITASKLVTEAIKGVHNVYWESNRYKDWDGIIEDKRVLIEKSREHVEKNCGGKDPFLILLDSRLKKDMYSKEDIEAVKTILGELDAKGFRSLIASNIGGEHYETNSSTGIIKYNNQLACRAFWGLDESDFYIVNVTGIGYALRYITGSGLELFGMFSGNKSNVDTLSRIKAKQKEKLKEIGEYKTGIYTDINKMLVEFIGEIRGNYSEIYLYGIDEVSIALAIDKSIDLIKILNRIYIAVNKINIGNCIDCVDIVDSMSSGKSEVECGVDSRFRLNIRDIPKVINRNEFISGRDKDAIIKLFDIGKMGD